MVSLFTNYADYAAHNITTGQIANDCLLYFPSMRSWFSGLRAMSFLWPAIPAHLGCCTVSTSGANTFLLVVSIPTAPSTPDVCSLLATTHGWCTLWHMLTSVSWPPSNPLWNKRRWNVHSSSTRRYDFVIFEFEWVIVENKIPTVIINEKTRAIIETMVCEIL